MTWKNQRNKNTLLAIPIHTYIYICMYLSIYTYIYVCICLSIHIYSIGKIIQPHAANYLDLHIFYPYIAVCIWIYMSSMRP